MKLLIALTAAAAALAAVLLLLVFAPDSQPSATTVVVQGTTDVRDSGLLEDVIVPGFEAAYPQYTLKYVAVGSGEAIANAKAGQADALLTHAPSDEKTFVEEGYSLEPRGRAVFYSDYVIVGPADDPAGVLAAARHDAVRAFELIAGAGARGEATFVSRGDDSGTNTQEKEIWKLTDVSLNAGDEPGDGTDKGNPEWYGKAGLGQAETVLLTQQCPFAAGACYEMTDRGTFNRLVANGSVDALGIVSDRNAPAARGGRNLLTNPFSAYAIESSKVPAGTNAEGATAFLDYLTSPGFQAKLVGYPDADSPAFTADARPEIAITSPLPKRVGGGSQVRIAGSAGNPLPGSPALAGQPVLLQQGIAATSAGGPAYETVAATTTTADGAFAFAFPATAGGEMRLLMPATNAYPPLSKEPLIAVGSLRAAELELGTLVVRPEDRRREQPVPAD